MKKLLASETFRELVLVLMRALFPLLRLLRLCDRSSAEMDKLAYFVRKAEESLTQSLERLDDEMFVECGIEASFADDSLSDDEDDGGGSVDMGCGEASEASDDEEEEIKLGSHIKECFMKRKNVLLHDCAWAGESISASVSCCVSCPVA